MFQSSIRYKTGKAFVLFVQHRNAMILHPVFSVAPELDNWYQPRLLAMPGNVSVHDLIRFLE